jgi:TldD protein
MPGRYHDLRQVKGYQVHIDVDNGVVETAGTSFFDDTVLRVLGPKGWGVVILNSFDPDGGSLDKVLNEAGDLAQMTHEEITLAPPARGARPVPSLSEDPADVDLEEKIRLLRAVERATAIPEVKNSRATYVESREQVRFLDSSGFDQMSVVTRCGFSVMAVAERGGVMQMARESHHTIGGFNLRQGWERRRVAGRLPFWMPPRLRGGGSMWCWIPSWGEYSPMKQ